MSKLQQQIERYADLVIRVGVRIQPGQKLAINATLDSADLVRALVRKAYEAGAFSVKVNWSDDTIARTRYELAPDEAFLEEPKWYAGEMTELGEQGGAAISVVSSDPDLLKGIDKQRIVNHQKTYGKAMAAYRQMTQSDKFSWCVVAAPSKAWAAKVFPGSTEEEQYISLWTSILKAVRCDLDDPVAAWEEHIASLNARSQHLNARKYKKLHYTAPGTDLTIELPDGHLWVAADSINEAGIPFVANLPTEEVFTAAKADGVNGYVSSTKPLSYGGNIIDNFKLTFENGSVVKAEAERGLETLEGLLEMDAGARRIGEVALVPHDSPISRSNILYYNTLFDENASNHLALGSAYAFNIEGGKGLSQEELAARGLNTSLTHVDFMIGSADMNIDGIAEDGSAEPIFRAGNWAF
ncbi:aminopeptidase [Paenibacillus albicereus]|uniref:Aminopeptidase n=1 Tax=Paenibacillus albicereus TaxID=2726185 RepID=A0A6H2GWE7_9BACL|nr:aminopeptidase [Paenibacillus albicereus]QJC51740.1 aminopeptidase [Paenibacillus albicereus]